MHIEKGDAIAFAKFAAFDIEEATANLAQVTNRHVTGNQRVGNALQKSALKVDVGAADFRKFDLEQSRVLFKLRTRNFAQLDRSVWFRNDSDDRHLKEKGKRKREKREDVEDRRPTCVCGVTGAIARP